MSTDPTVHIDPFAAVGLDEAWLREVLGLDSRQVDTVRYLADERFDWLQEAHVALQEHVAAYARLLHVPMMPFAAISLARTVVELCSTTMYLTDRKISAYDRMVRYGAFMLGSTSDFMKQLQGDETSPNQYQDSWSDAGFDLQVPSHSPRAQGIRTKAGEVVSTHKLKMGDLISAFAEDLGLVDTNHYALFSMWAHSRGTIYLRPLRADVPDRAVYGTLYAIYSTQAVSKFVASAFTRFLDEIEQPSTLVKESAMAADQALDDFRVARIKSVTYQFGE